MAERSVSGQAERLDVLDVARWGVVNAAVAAADAWEQRGAAAAIGVLGQRLVPAVAALRAAAAGRNGDTS